MASGQLAVLAEIETPGGWLQLQDPDNGYELHKDSFNGSSVGSRKTTIESDWVEGEYVTRAVRTNVNENVAVWVEGATPFECWGRVEAFVAGLEQLQFKLRATFADSRETWTCFYSDYQIESSQEMRFSTLVLVRATIPRLPTLLREQVVP